MNEIVKSYGDAAGCRVERITDVIDGTAFFPGGHGVWRGVQPHGPIARFFPEDCVMFVGHNFDSVAGYEASLKRGIERVNGTTWSKLLQYVAFAGLQPEQCFFTNALMGLQPGSSIGVLKTVGSFRSECRSFLQVQIDVVRPKAVVALGRHASEEIRLAEIAMPWIAVRHPYSAFQHKDICKAEGDRIATFLADPTAAK